MEEFEVGDIVQGGEYICRVTAVEDRHFDGLTAWDLVKKNRGCYKDSYVRLTISDYRIIKKHNMASTSIKEKFALAFKGEPEKSLIKAGLLNIDESLTADGQAIFLAWLLKKNAEAFKKEVAEVILADEEKK